MKTKVILSVLLSIMPSVASAKSHALGALSFDCEDSNYTYSDGIKAKFSIRFTSDWKSAQIEFKRKPKFQTIIHTGEFRWGHVSQIDRITSGGMAQAQQYEVTKVDRRVIVETKSEEGIVSVLRNEVIIDSSDFHLVMKPRNAGNYEQNTHEGAYTRTGDQWILEDGAATLTVKTESGAVTDKSYCRNYTPVTLPQNLQMHLGKTEL